MESLLAYHCGPALAGIKVANIATCYKDKIKDVHGEVERLNLDMNKKDIYIEILCECDRKAMVIVYRKNLLEKHLEESEIKEFLNKYNYPETVNLREYFEILKTRLEGKSFPHEIGAFLGYPLCDIQGFICHRPCVFTGDWKVYDNAEETKKLFCRFEKCRRAIMKRLETGKTLSEVFCCA